MSRYYKKIEAQMMLKTRDNRMVQVGVVNLELSVDADLITKESGSTNTVMRLEEMIADSREDMQEAYDDLSKLTADDVYSDAEGRAPIVFLIK